MEKNISCKQKWQEIGDHSTVSDKKDFKTKAIKKHTEGHYTMTKGSIQEDILSNIYEPNIEATK